MWWVASLRPILRDARLWRAPQDEVLFRGEILDPHGEERRLRRVSNHEAKYAIGPYAIALPQEGRGKNYPRLTLAPPSTGSVTPVMKFASSDARNSAALATSQAVPIFLRSGTLLSRSAATSARVLCH